MVAPLIPATLASCGPTGFHYHFPGAHQVIYHNGHRVFGAANQQYRHGSGLVFQMRGAATMDEVAQVDQFVILAYVGVHRIVFFKIMLQFEGADTHNAFDLVQRNGIGIFRRFHHQGAVHGQGEGQANNEPRALPLARINGDRATHLLDFAGHHIHAYASPGNLGHGGRRREAGMEDKLLDFLIRELRIRRHQASLDGFIQYRFGINPLAVIGQGDHHLAPFSAQFQIDATGIILAGRLTSLGGFDTVVHRVTQHVLQRRDHTLHQRAVQFAFRVKHIEVHTLAHFTGNLAHDTAQTRYQSGERYHARAPSFSCSSVLIRDCRNSRVSVSLVRSIRVLRKSSKSEADSDNCLVI